MWFHDFSIYRNKVVTDIIYKELNEESPLRIGSMFLPDVKNVLIIFGLTIEIKHAKERKRIPRVGWDIMSLIGLKIKNKKIVS